MKKAFALVELVVAIAILALVMLIAGMVFNVSVNSSRIGFANAEIMQKLRAITNQLNTDFRGIRKDAPMAIRFWRDVDGTRRDSIAFVANGDFQSIKQYWRNDELNGLIQRTTRGNVASIYYGLASDSNILAHKHKIFTSDPCLLEASFLADSNEFLIDSLSRWRINLNDISFADWTVSPSIDLYRLDRDLPLYMTSGIDNFMIQIAMLNPESKKFIWFPDNSFFDDNEIFGFFYNIPANIELDNWYDESINWPEALKFTFTLHDSKGIIENGRTFTHIVYSKKQLELPVPQCLYKGE